MNEQIYPGDRIQIDFPNGKDLTGTVRTVYLMPKTGKLILTVEKENGNAVIWHQEASKGKLTKL